MYALPVDLLIIQSSCHFHLWCKQGLSYAVAIFVCFVVCLFVFLGKITDWGSWDWSAFNEPLSLTQVCGFQTWIFIASFCVLYFILSEFLTKDVFECIVNPTYLIGCCNYTLTNLVLKTIVLIFNTTHKMGCCEYCYWLGWYNIWRVKSGSLNYPFLR